MPKATDSADHTQAARGALTRAAWGILLGVAAIIPGLSGGAMAVSLGLYEPAVAAAGSLLRHPRKSLVFLVPLGAGVVVGVLGFSNIIKFLYATFPIQLICLFTGLVAGSLPAAVRQAVSRGFRWGYVAAFAAGALLVVAFHLADTMSAVQAQAQVWSFPLGLLSGAILAFGTVIPGISSSFLLIDLGTYGQLMDAISGIDVIKLIPVALGALVAAAALIKLVEYAFKRFYGTSHFMVLGFLLASIALVFPPLKPDWTLAVNSVILLLSAAGSYWLMGRRQHKPCEDEAKEPAV